MTAIGRGREAELAARWSAGMWRGATLQSERGEAFRVIFEGRRGGGAGPDFRDAVLARADGTRLYGDIELHLRPAGWYAHGHSSDPRYNGLALHVVLTRGTRDPTETALASGRTVPLIVLGGEPPLPLPQARAGWPCAVSPRQDMTDLLRHAGMARFTEHATHLEQELRSCSISPARESAWDAPNRVLWLAMAEALGYGRDRATLRRLGAALLDTHSVPSGHAALPGVERMRARGLLVWHERWRQDGPWHSVETAIRHGDPRRAVRALIAELRVAERGSVSSQRAAIVAVNVTLPFATALATMRRDDTLARRSLALYQAWPGLPSNQIVREMARTLGLSRLPRGAVTQQGLHHLWQSLCHEKQCERCPCHCL